MGWSLRVHLNCAQPFSLDCCLAQFDLFFFVLLSLKVAMLKATYGKSSEKRESDRMQRDADDLYNPERQFIPISSLSQK